MAGLAIVLNLLAQDHGVQGLWLLSSVALALALHRKAETSTVTAGIAEYFGFRQCYRVYRGITEIEPFSFGPPKLHLSELK